MENEYKVGEIDDKIQLLKKYAMDLTEMADDFPSLYRNCRRILASTKMLELNISDIKDLLD
jgi:hypothetical protein